MGIEDFRQIVGVVLGKGGGLNEPNKLPQGSATAPTGYSPSLFIKWRYHHLNLFYIHYQTFLPSQSLVRPRIPLLMNLIYLWVYSWRLVLDVLKEGIKVP